MCLRKVSAVYLLIIPAIAMIQLISGRKGYNEECRSVIETVHQNETREHQKYDAVMDMFTILLKERKQCKCVEQHVHFLQDRKRKFLNVKIEDEVKLCKHKTRKDISSFKIFHGTVIGRKYEAVMDMLTLLLEDRRSCECLRKSVRKLTKELKEMGKGINKISECRQLYLSGKKKNGVYKISPVKKQSFNVYCDMENGGWTVIQRRFNGSVSFDRTWLEYANGFGDLRADHWLGLKHMNQITSVPNSSYYLKFDLIVNGKKATVEYENFRVGDAISKFMLHVDETVKYNSEMMNCVKDNGFYYQNARKFTTKDSDNDSYKANCAQNYENGGWWYGSCYNANLNKGFTSMTFSSCKVSKSEMKIRPKF